MLILPTRPEGHSPAYTFIKERLEGDLAQILTEKVDCWFQLSSERGVSIEIPGGGAINLGGVEFSGSARDVFWGPFMFKVLSSLISHTFEFTRNFCSEHQIDSGQPLEETSMCLQLVCSRVYNRMVDVDRRLRGKGDPRSVPKYDASGHESKIREFTFERLDAERVIGVKAASKMLEKPENRSQMYNLFVSGNEESWLGNPWEQTASRCVKSDEYTESGIAKLFKDLSKENFEELRKYPCLFAYETSLKKPAHIGWITRVRRNGADVRVEYRFEEEYPPVDYEDILEMKWELSLTDWEMGRSHWAVKEENLSEALESKDYPSILSEATNTEIIDVETQHFDVALSFPGEIRNDVKKVADAVQKALGRGAVFYDNYFQAQLARPNLDTFLQNIYKDRTKLIVVCLSKDYARKEWCGIEFRAVKEILRKKADKQIMYLRYDDAEIDGVLSIDGYIPMDQLTAEEVIPMILERVELLKV